VLALWAASASSLLVAQAQRVFGPQTPHPEVPGDEPQAVLAVLDGCRRRVSAQDTLGVVYAEGDAQLHFLAFRLAYELYPRLVFSESYAEGHAAEALARIREQHPSQLLILGAPDVPVTQVTLIERLGPKAHLLRVVGTSPR
jgi:hypothetical protein